ncbi:MAG: hypothetical protein WC382_00950 [Methanoregulaceae archaeon]
MDSTGFEPVAFTFQTEGSGLRTAGDLHSPLFRTIPEMMIMDSTGFEPVAFTFQTEGSGLRTAGDLRSPLF